MQPKIKSLVRPQAPCLPPGQQQGVPVIVLLQLQHKSAFPNTICYLILELATAGPLSLSEKLILGMGTMQLSFFSFFSQAHAAQATPLQKVDA